jgi:hypothetical protein
LARRRAEQRHNALSVVVNLQPDMIRAPYYGLRVLALDRKRS